MSRRFYLWCAEFNEIYWQIYCDDSYRDEIRKYRELLVDEDAVLYELLQYIDWKLLYQSGDFRRKLRIRHRVLNSAWREYLRD